MRSLATGTVEQWAQRIVENTTGASVVIHDDGSRPSMYDLRVGVEANPEIAIEVTGAVDPSFTATWNTGPARGPMTMQLQGDWTIEILPGTYVRKIAAQLQGLLQVLESEYDGDISVPVDHILRQYNRRSYDDFEAIGVSYINRFRPSGSGKVSFVMPGSSGAVDDAGASLPGWVGTWLRAPERGDNLRKLAASGARRREAFIVATIEGASWPVMSYLTGEMATAPTLPPDLPPPLTGVWVCPTHGSRGVYWDGGKWHLVEVRTP